MDESYILSEVQRAVLSIVNLEARSRKQLRGDDYVGVGEGAAGRLHSQGKIWATSYPRRLEELSAADRAEELTIFGLRLNDGLDKELFKQNCGLAWEDFANPGRVAKLIRDGLVEDTPQNIRATSAGRLLLDYVIEQICL